MSHASMAHPVGTDRWGITEDCDRRFRRILLQVALMWFSFVFVGQLLPPPEPLSAAGETARHYIEVLPDPRPAPVKAKPKPVPKPEVAKPVVRETPPPAPVVPTMKPVSEEAQRKAARAVAEQAGIMTLRQQLRDLRDPGNSAMQQPVSLREQQQPVTIAASAGDIVSTARTASAGSGNLGGRGVSREQATTTLTSLQTRRVSDTAASRSSAEVGERGNPASVARGRSLEEIQLAFDRSKGAFYAIFNRAARRDIKIRSGSVVISLTIAPSGEVTDCALVSTTFHNPELERKLLQRVKLLKFEARAVPTFTYSNYPISYVPS